MTSMHACMLDIRKYMKCVIDLRSADIASLEKGPGFWLQVNTPYRYTHHTHTYTKGRQDKVTFRTQRRDVGS